MRIGVSSKQQALALVQAQINHPDNGGYYFESITSLAKGALPSSALLVFDGGLGHDLHLFLGADGTWSLSIEVPA